MLNNHGSPLIIIDNERVYEKEPEQPNCVHFVDIHAIPHTNLCGAPVTPGYGHPECSDPIVGWPVSKLDDDGTPYCPSCFRPVCATCTRIIREVEQR